MRVFFAFVLYLFVSCVAGSTLGWLLSLGVDYPYEKLLSRSVLLFAALGLVPLWRFVDLSIADVGLTPAPRFADLGRWFSVGIVLILPLAWLFWFIEFRVIDPRLSGPSLETLIVFAWLLFSAFLVGIFEEVLFRGVIYGALRRLYGFFGSAAIVSFCYASVHFLELKEVLTEPTWWSGIVITAEAFAGVLQPESWDSWLSLFLLGWVFCLLRERISLWAAVSLHASFVFSLRAYKELTVRDVVHPLRGLVGDFDNFLGVAALVWLAFILVVVALWDQYRQGVLGESK